MSTAAVFSEYESFEWLFRETYKKAGCYVLGAKLLQFFETPKFFVIILRTHCFYFVKGFDMMLILRLFVHFNLSELFSSSSP